MTKTENLEIHLERMRYLLNTDDMLEQILEEQNGPMPILSNQIDHQYISQNGLGLEITF